MLHFVRNLNEALILFLGIAYAYQGVYTLIGLWLRWREQKRPQARLHKYAAVISARNEENVIGDLIASLKAQRYPAELLDVYVIADNCTDHTAEAAQAAGATVFRRFNRQEVGKGYALDWFFDRLCKEHQDYDGYFVFDADNIVDPNFVAEMNRTFDSGKYDALTSYRNSKNFGQCWISAGYSIWFLREARFLNAVRCALGLSCAISGTGFLVSDRLVRENKGWPFHLLTEDIQFSVDCAARGRRIGYCGRAMVYDEQPITMRQSWNQRLRWSKGFYQVDLRYGLSLLRGIFYGGRRGFSCYDMLMTVAPAMLLNVGLVVFNVIIAVACLSLPDFLANWVIREVVRTLVFLLVNFYIGMLLCGALTIFTEWHAIQEKPLRKLLYLPAFPIFMLTYIPISLVALVRRVEWKPIRHGVVKKVGKAV